MALKQTPRQANKDVSTKICTNLIVLDFFCFAFNLDFHLEKNTLKTNIQTKTKINRR
jgi:hypothetical protein